MVRYMNPGGFNSGPQNLDGYGISNIVVAVTYSVFFYAACIYLWCSRHHPLLQKRNVPLILLSLLILHVFAFMVMMYYTLNGAFTCQVEFWGMNIYLPIGVGLFQAQNQQLLVVSQKQAQLIVTDDLYKPIFPKTGRGIGGPKYWIFRLKVWWNSIGSQGKYQAVIFAGIIVQFLVSFIIYNISRKFNHYGVVDHHTSPALCRRGWEWVPSIIWQFLWNFIFGPYLIWKIRMVRDIYHWRLQTILAVVAGLPGTPLWLAAVYSSSFVPVNKYWIPGMWLVPGIFTMEIVTLGFPIYQILKYRNAVRATNLVLEEFDQKRQNNSDDATATSDSLKTRSTAKSHGRMYSMESLNECLSSSPNGLQIYASCMELNGENIIFLTKVLSFGKSCQHSFYATCKSTHEFRRARSTMFRVALSIFLSLVHSGTAPYPINIESPIYNRLDAIFGPAAALVAVTKRSRSSSLSRISSSNVTPWDEPNDGEEASGSENEFRMRPMASDGLSTPTSNVKPNESSEHIVSAGAGDIEDVVRGAESIPMKDIKVPADFDENVFEAAFKSINYMVWTGTWQRYMVWKRTSGSEAGA